MFEVKRLHQSTHLPTQWGGRPAALCAARRVGVMKLSIPMTARAVLLYVSEKKCVRKKASAGAPQNPGAATIELGNDERRSCYFFFLAAFFLAAGFLAAFFFAIILYLLRLVIRTRGSMDWRAGIPRVT